MIKYKFLSPKESQNQLSKSDDFSKNLSSLSLQMLQIRNEQDYLRSIKESSCLNFTNQEQNKISGFMNTINNSLEELNLKLDIDICFSKTNGQESFGMPYTRFNTIVLTVPYLMAQERGMKVGNIDMGEGLVAHEIFHVLSRKFPKIREELYSLHSFKFNPIKDYIPNVITNPDAPNHDYTVVVNHKEKKKEVRPVLAMVGMNIQNADKQLFYNGEFISQDQTNYLEVIKSNSNYSTYHPEEVCAEDFRILISGKNFPQKETFLKILKSI